MVPPNIVSVHFLLLKNIPREEAILSAMRKPNKKLRDALDASYEGVVLADGHDNAIMGVAEGGGGPPRLVYDRDKVIQNLIAGGIEDYGEAIEFFEFNIAGAYVGEQTPLFLTKRKDILW